MAQPTAYQRVTTSTDYDASAGVMALVFDGVDDSMYSAASVDFTSTDKMTVFAGVHKASDAGYGILVETSADATGGNVGAFFVAAPWTAGTYRSASAGSSPTAAETATTYTAPITSVLAMTANIPADQLALRVNGAQVASSAFDQGTGNYGNYPLHIGRRNNSANPFNGRLYQLAIKGKAMTAAEISTVESYINSKTKAY